MKLPSGGNHPERVERNRILEAADAQNHKRNRDVEIGQGRLILTATDGARWVVTVTPAGTIGAEDESGVAGADATAYSPGSMTIATETSKSFGKTVKLTGTQRLTVEGTGRARVVN